MPTLRLNQNKVGEYRMREKIRFENQAPMYSEFDFEMTQQGMKGKIITQVWPSASPQCMRGAEAEPANKAMEVMVL